MCAEGPLDGLPVRALRSRPAFRRLQHDHGPARAAGGASRSRLVLDLPDAAEARVQSGGHLAMHICGLVSDDEERVPSATPHELFELGVGDAREDRRIGDLVSVEMEDGQDRSVVNGIEELVGVPRRRERSGLGLAIADHARDEEVRIVENGAGGMAERVAQLAALVDGARSLRRDVARDPTRKRELSEERSQARLVARDARIHLRVGPFEVDVGDEGRASVSGSGDVDGVQIVLADQPVQVDVDQVEAGGGAPVAEQPRLDVLCFQRHAQQRVVEQIDLSDRKVVGGAPVGVHPARAGTVGLVTGPPASREPRGR